MSIPIVWWMDRVLLAPPFQTKRDIQMLTGAMGYIPNLYPHPSATTGNEGSCVQNWEESHQGLTSAATSQVSVYISSGQYLSIIDGSGKLWFVLDQYFSGSIHLCLVLPIAVMLHPPSKHRSVLASNPYDYSQQLHDHDKSTNWGIRWLIWQHR